MRIGRILFLAILFFSLTTILAVSSFFEGQAYSSIAALNLFDQNGQIQFTSVKDSYKNEVLALLEQYSQKQISLTDLEQKLFAIRVPKSYQDLHLGLVSAVGDLNQSAPNIEEAKNRFEKLKDQYAWLTASLTIFLANIF
ncbi:MAG: hypothetical protein Q8P32_02860 [Candidatus Komeilibacteria bacterium]|nr:hypothetical protein [Candidatus Komeilibacteria bacterium]